MKLKNIKIGDYIEAKNNDDGMIEKGQLYKVFAIDTDDTVAVDATKAGGIWWVDPADFRKPRTKLKQLDQSAFNGLDEGWRFVAVDKDGTAYIYQSKPRAGSTYFIGGNGCDYVEFGTGYDATNWENSLIEREPELQLKQLDQSVFDGLEENWQFAAVDGRTGRAYVYEQKPHIMHIKMQYWCIDDGLQHIVGDDYDASNWENSLIERESKELTGSELCKAMLARGDKYVMCRVSDIGDSEVSEDFTHVIRGFSQSGFETKRSIWQYAVPINNQGEPLTAAEAGL